MEFKEAKRMELFGQYAVAASAEAIAQSGLALEMEDRTRIGVSVGCGIGSMPDSGKIVLRNWRQKVRGAFRR